MEQSFTRRQLYDLVWKEPIQILAPKFGLSDRGLAKVCERHGIPTPPRGYWAKQQAGHKVTKVPLLELEGSRIRETYAIATFAPPKSDTPVAPDAPDPLLGFWQAQRDEIGEIKVAKTLANPHPVIASWIKEDDRQRDVDARWGRPSFGLSRTTPLEKRRLRLLSALYKALEARGVTIHCPRNGRVVELRHRHDAASFALREYTQQKRRPLTEAEQQDRWNADAKYKQEYIETGFLRGKVDAYLPRGVPVQWTETAEKPFETMLGEVAASILAALAHARTVREQRAEEERLRWQRQEAARKRAEEEKAERERKRALRGRAKDWRRAQDLRAYVTAVGDAAAAGDLSVEASELAAWTDWALTHARELDPLIAGDALCTDPRP